MRSLLIATFVVVFLAGCSSSPSSPAISTDPGPTEVFAVADTHHGEHFEPMDRVVHVGDTLTFKVMGSSAHTVDFGVDSTSPVDGVSNAHSGNLAPGSTSQVTFTKAGHYPYFCQYHVPGMTGHVMVE